MKGYHEHEATYRRMKEIGTPSWGERPGIPGHSPQSIDQDTKRFLRDALAQPWVPSSGSLLELGCGTAPILRELLSISSFSRGTGVDVSRTALELAAEQSTGFPVEFRQLDLCTDLLPSIGKFELLVDGHCLHCICDPGDRRNFLRNARDLLAPDGVAIFISMCSPMNRKRFAEFFPHQKLRKGVIYSPSAVATSYVDSICSAGDSYLATRFIGHWKALLRELKCAGFLPRLHRYSAASGDEVVGNLAAACVAGGPRSTRNGSR